MKPHLKTFASNISKWMLSLFVGLITSSNINADQQISHTIDTSYTNFQPFESRNQNLFNLIHGQALPTNARLNKKDQSKWSGSLIITNTITIESANNESIYLDYESYRFNLSYQYGLNDKWNLKIDVPLLHQTGGTFDSAIDKWHEFFNLPEGQRPLAKHDQYSIQYNLQSTSLIDLTETNTSLGDIQIAVARELLNNADTTMSLWASIKLPTGDEDNLSGSGSTDFSFWLAMNQQLSKNWALNVNAGSVVTGSDNYHGIPLSDYTFYGHAMLGWAVSENINLKAQLQAHTSYYDKSQLDILDDTALLTVGASIKINSCQQMDIAISEDIKVNSSPDISLLLNWRAYTSYC